MNVDLQKVRELCDPSRDQKIFVDDIIIEKGALKHLPSIMKEKYGQFKNVVMICDQNTYEAAGKKVEQLLPAIHTVILDPTDLHANEIGVAAAEKELNQYGDVDFMIACGSGTIHDITRYHAYNRKINFLSIPTAASVDGFVSTVAAMTWHGFKKSFTAVSPVFVLADSEIFSHAPARLTASGVGDLIGKYTSICDWKIAHAVTGEYISMPVVEWEQEILKDLIDNLDGIGKHDFKAYENLMYGLLLSGLAMQMIGNSRPASGAEHHCSHLWEMAAINEPIDFLHGEKVGVGLCLVSAVYKRALAKLKEGNYTVKSHMDVETDFIKEHFKNETLQKAILEENTPNLMADITADQLKAKEAEIITILEELPSAEQIIGWMKKVNALTTIEELTLDESLRPLTLKLSPYVRQRLTFMRLLKFYDFYDEVIEG
ncbi:sn-glycerol-1-phosphate dehydrogenase [Catenisphaera adipataccumulans]|jgi:glycerol-1-phosphate dehydrogenase [NAD(P)+]|uniref:Glycerol-1-phosphate dehydrogenase [NAD(P)+] n=1 Tax=Catenisphaera adipataccumulans TaxID=700500 RepID=A0A7W8CXJ7_9FIRM|nr:sn-glycerol-1-phosphate dehydrogenase [Catenisphaera adipataccumulans]MBB5182774.1 glycerol-1-phosphate dehydrogenase [NAD(P)+] [Catenisphaera adipataccumulans]